MAEPDAASRPETLPPRFREAAGLLLDVDPTMLKGFPIRATRPDGSSLTMKQLFAALAAQPQPHSRGRVSHGRDEDGVVRRHTVQLHASETSPDDPDHDLAGVLVVAELPDGVEPPRPARRRAKRTVGSVDSDGATIQMSDVSTDPFQTRRASQRVGRGPVHAPARGQASA